ncbi:MAG: PD-(D/E)XK nuclease family protein [Gammaproteobacteria bacterium]|nr:PD-(D/E)XK nuclease family protein [Gammaproteobacteria bacterium]
MTSRLQDWLRPGITIVTSSARLAQRLSWQYTQSRLAAGAAAWQTPDILTWNRWVVRLWQEQQWIGARTEALLSAAQRRFLWQQIIESSPWREHLLQPAAVAERAVEAWQTLQQWGVPAFPDGVFLNEDARAFRSWSTAYARRCDDKRWLDEASLPEKLAACIVAVPAGNARAAVFVGFDELPPMHRQLLGSLENAGVAVAQPPAPRCATAARCVPFNDTRAELIAAANWARHHLTREPDAAIGVVVPGLQSLRALVQDIFDDVLAPASLLSIPDAYQRPFSIAAGRPLTGQPLISHALLLLELARERLAMVDVTTLLHSPYLRGAEAEQAARPVLDAGLRRRREPELGLGTILAECAGGRFAGAPEMVRALGALQVRSRVTPGRQRPASWARDFSELLAAAGWPGDRPLASIEYQTLSAWRELLGEFASLDNVAGSLGFGAALHHLRRLAAERSFQPQTPEAPIQIIDLAGAADMGFDRLWTTGWHEEAWPRAAQPNPFLPLALQREYGMPRSSAEVELARACRITGSLLSCCPDVIVSWPRQDGDRVLRPSPMTAGLAPGETPVEAVEGWMEVVFRHRRVETFSDETGPVLPPGAQVHGGAALFKHQAACPFRAFARFRLGADSLAEVDVGLDALERGDLVHAMMQRLWQSLRTHKALLAAAAGELEALIRQAVDDALSPVVARHPQVFTRRFLAIERERLCALAREWLDLERGRAPFTVVACEQPRPFQLGGIAGQLRVDRIDALADGRHVILDYKTGKVPARPWDGSRPEEPQLPLYAVTGGEPVAAVAFARIARGECSLNGVAADADLLPGVGPSENWDGLIGGWRSVLVDLAAEFERGHAPVQPRDGAATCRVCDLHPLCRVHELVAARDDSEDRHGE